MPDSISKTGGSSFHPALSVSNIRNHVSIVLEMENVKYGTWAEIFKIHARSHKVLHHIVPPPSEATTMEAWDRQRNIYQDHRTSRAVILEQEFTTTRQDDFPNAFA
ncbi:uncharacterized protein [Spinacia oleracea]|uniref:Uncharacterized protein n=1 Tax=Spinacia oleracea TaxID=3562 RepID=A0ABM3QYQ8_SPIOL|nr:uncharacterized protein LOC130463392 [Spinacia oleracea]